MEMLSYWNQKVGRSVIAGTWISAFEEGVKTDQIGGRCGLTRCRSGINGSSTGSENMLDGLHRCGIRMNLTRVSSGKVMVVKNSNKGRKSCESTPYLQPCVRRLVPYKHTSFRLGVAAVEAIVRRDIFEGTPQGFSIGSLDFRL